MKNYPTKFKVSIQRKLLPPHNLSIPYLAKKEGISKSTLYQWRKEASVLNSTYVIKQLQQEIRHLERKLAYREKNTLRKTLSIRDVENIKNNLHYFFSGCYETLKIIPLPSLECDNHHI
ncbi:transposase [Xenorhabdus nematophila]|uniref:transposase n=1 Tax=Xenorhabdus nematophila TaxID=628 RepID=UPI000570882C|nr:transposase [Xenorhabdus nematophila]